MSVNRHIRLGLTLAVLLCLAGCISLVSTPDFARPGDVVNVGLGGIKRNADGQLLEQDDVSVTITDSASVVHTPQVLGVYRAFPDYASQYSVQAQVGAPTANDLYPHDGAVWVTIRLTDPLNFPLPMATGPAVLAVSAPKLTQTAHANDGVYSNFPIEILPGTGQPSQSDSQNLAYQPNGYLSIKPNATPTTTIGGAQIEVTFKRSYVPATPFDLRAVPLNHDPNLSLIQSIEENGDGTATLTAILTNPNGFTAVTSWTQGQSSYYDLGLALVSDGGGVAAVSNAQLPTSTDISITGYYIDLNGDTVPSLNPVLLNEFF